jgi:hypothetical protein
MHIYGIRVRLACKENFQSKSWNFFTDLGGRCAIALAHLLDSTLNLQSYPDTMHYLCIAVVLMKSSVFHVFTLCGCARFNMRRDTTKRHER